MFNVLCAKDTAVNKSEQKNNPTFMEFTFWLGKTNNTWVFEKKRKGDEEPDSNFFIWLGPASPR